MDLQPTCGQGLAEHSALPAKLSELMAAMAENLELHKTALILEDENARQEHDAYVRLANETRDVASRLAAVAEHMASYRDLPMARHDEEAFANPMFLEAFSAFVKAEQELLALLQKSLEGDRAMLAGMEAGGQRR